MPTYQIHFKANPALWPTDPQENLALWEQTVQGADAMLETGAMRDLYFVSATEGYVCVAADTKADAVAVAASRAVRSTCPTESLLQLTAGSSRR